MQYYQSILNLYFSFVNRNHMKNAEQKRLIRKSLRKAFNLWQKSSVLKFIETNNPVADILIDFGRFVGQLVLIGSLVYRSFGNFQERS